MKKIVIITTVPLSLANLIKGQPKYLSKFYNVKLVTSSSPINSKISDFEGIDIKAIDMTRKITPLQDLKQFTGFINIFHMKILMLFIHLLQKLDFLV